jgi:hypothetical protein
MEEVFKDIPGYEGVYQVSNLGGIKSLDRKVTHKNCVPRFKKGKIITPAINKYGYKQVVLSLNSKQKSICLHLLIARTFINNETKLQVNHKDFNKLNNNISNLEFVTHLENLIHKSENSKHSSKYIGISYYKRDNLWQAEVKRNKIKYYLGRFKTEEEANQVRLNFLFENKF